MKNGDRSINVIDGYHGDSCLKGGHTGLTKREYFAAMAMPSIIEAAADNTKLFALDAEMMETSVEMVIARSAVTQADALLKALEE